MQIFEQTDEHIDIGFQFWQEEDEMRSWLTENLGQRSIYSGWGWICSLNYHGFRIYKNNKDKFVLFQLTWL